MALRERGGKPIIYLYPPTTIKATVKLSLSLDWSLSAVYPIPPGLKPTRFASESADYGRVVQWNVTAHPDGTVLVNTADDAVEATYLFWEAEYVLLLSPFRIDRLRLIALSLPSTHPQPRQGEGIETSRLPSHVEDADLDFPKNFTPGSSECSPQDSVLLPVDEVPDYLDKALLALGLHTEGRTSFITFWLPSILKREHIAFRFIHQYDLNTAAKLQISPTPDVVTRIFMLFQGVPSSELKHWKDGMGQGKESKKGSVAKVWRDVVGVKAEDR
ncbi:hypothetical protein FS837_003547 [Tulasnella sp. UAMH 9824]|nr:hypothetical protein FS837_003547 [Tulasnella sp. UAMH 9824]